jgi:hypothetical protein
MYNTSLAQLAISIVDNHDNIFEEESIHEIYILGNNEYD